LKEYDSGSISTDVQLLNLAAFFDITANFAPIYVGGTYGTEVDVTGTYKITNYLSYMLGFGYLFTGDYFKCPSGTNKVDDDYLLINKLPLTFLAHRC
jgi:hypothetical protein